jgi:ATP-dependent RNA helicase SUPV3L1/SUV3
LGFRLDRVRVPSPAPASAVAASPAAAPIEPRGDGPAAAANEQVAQPETTFAEQAGETPAASPPAAPGNEVAPAQEAPPPVQAAAEERWEEIWRPRRHHGQRPRRFGRDHRARAKPEGEAAAQQQAKPKRHGRPERRDRRREGHGHRGRRDDRPRPAVQSASPPSKAGFDPDSPFAALHSLKLALEKPRPE